VLGYAACRSVLRHCLLCMHSFLTPWISHAVHHLVLCDAENHQRLLIAGDFCRDPTPHCFCIVGVCYCQVKSISFHFLWSQFRLKQQTGPSKHNQNQNYNQHQIYFHMDVQNVETTLGHKW
jgi:hypothetical protein